MRKHGILFSSIIDKHNYFRHRRTRYKPFTYIYCITADLFLIQNYERY